MPILNDIMDHKVLGREFKRGLHEGELIGELAILRRQVEKRFGPIPAWAEQRLSAGSKDELEDLSVRILDAPTIEDLLK
jgi:hypothetical protein